MDRDPKATSASASLQTVTIIISDLVGSTGLAARVGPARADELRREHFAALREAVAANEGREVKNTGDGLMVAFQSASAGVRCAIAMQQHIERRNRDSSEHLQLRIGIAAGECTVEDDDYFGMVPVEAARLCDACAADQILATKVVRLMAGRGSATFATVGQLTLKGLPEPVDAFGIAWESLPTPPGGGIPLPGGIAAQARRQLTGRATERARLQRALREVPEGGRGAAFLSGEPGIGKTCLAAHLAVAAHAGGTTVCWGAAEEDVGAPYGAWIQALTHYVEHAPEAVLHEHVARQGGELARLVPALGQRRPDLPPPRATDADTERFRLFAAVADLLETAAARAPVLLALDDLHWADAETISLLRHVLGTCERAPLLVIGTYRAGEVGYEHPLSALLANLRRVPGIERIELAGLSVSEVSALMQDVVGHELGGPGMALAHEVTLETDGNPFFVLEIVHHLTESGAIARGADGRWTVVGSVAKLGLPQGVREIITQRIARLPDRVQRALDVGAVVGRSFDVELLARVIEVVEDELLDMLEEAVAASVLAESTEHIGRFGFVHALIDHTLYDGIEAGERCRLHHRVAVALEELYGRDAPDRLPDLAYHWSESAAIDPEQAIAYARLAGDRALAALAPDEAARWFARALKLHEAYISGSSADLDLGRAVLLARLGAALVRTGDSAARPRLLEAAEAARGAGAANLLAEIALSFGAFVLSPGYDEQLTALLGEALDVTPARDSVERVRLLTRLALALHYVPVAEQREALVTEAVGMARRLGDEPALCYALAMGHLATRSADTPRRTIEWTDEALRLNPDRPLEEAMYANRVNAYLELGDVNGARGELDALQRVIDDVPEPRALPLGPLLRARFAMISGEFDDAFALVDQAAEMGGRLADTTIPMLAFSMRVALLRLTDGTEPVIDMLRRVCEATPGMPSFRAALALAHLEGGREREAREEYERLAAGDFADLPRDSVWLLGASMCAELCAGLGDARRAAILYEALAPYAGHEVISPVATAPGPVDRFLAMLAAAAGRYDAAIEHHDAAWAAAAGHGARPVQVQLRREHAATLATRNEDGDAARALALLREARQIAPARMTIELARIDELERRVHPAPLGAET